MLEDQTFGLLSTKTGALLANTCWNIGFYTHIVFGGIALLTGWLQFNENLLKKRIKLHRLLGKIYVICVLLSAIAGIGIGFWATGGIISAAGFVGLGLVWFGTTLLAYLKIKAHQLEEHRKLMIFSYAACFAAVTLRLWLPTLMAITGDFMLAYKMLAWLCWVPNLLVATLVIKRLKPYKNT